MDPLSISSGIAGLLSIAVSIAQVSFEYVSCVKDAPKAIKDLIKEVTCLEEVLKGIRNELLLEPEVAQLRAQRMEDRWSGRDALVQDCEKDLHALLHELQNKVKAKKVKLLDRASWYFKEDAMNDRIGMLCRYRDQFTALTSQDILAVGTLTLKEVRDWRQEESNQKILRWLSPLDFAPRHQDISSKRQPETLRWLLASAEYRTWSRSDVPLANDKRLLWCYGDPGAGKTYASSRVLDHLTESSGSNKSGIAYVYCDYDDQNNQTLRNILGCILKQLAMQCTTLPDFVAELYPKDMCNPVNIEPELFWKILEQFNDKFPRTFLIIDALDELENDKLRTRRNLMRMMSMSQESKSDVRIFTTSRSHLGDINNVLGDFSKLLIEAHDSDMRSFLSQRIEASEDLEDMIDNDEDFKEEIIRTLLDKANKLFLIPALHIDRILESTSRAEIEETLENITGTIRDAYANTLRRIQNLPKTRSELALDALMWLSHSKRPLRFAELQEALAVRIGSKNINHKAYVSAKIVLSTCLGLIIIESDTEVVRLMHPTLEEYLRSSQDLFDDPAVKISRILLTYMRFPEPRKWLDNEIESQTPVFPESLFESSEKDFPFLLYSCMFWNRHTMVCQRELEVDILEYFRSRPYVLFSPLKHEFNWNYDDYRFRQLRDSSLSGPRIELIYAVIHLFHDVVLQLIKRGEAFQAICNVHVLPTALSCVSLLLRDIMTMEDEYRKGHQIELDTFLQTILKQGLTAKLHSSEQETLALSLPFVSVETMNIFFDCGFDVNWQCQLNLFAEGPWEISGLVSPIHIAARYRATTAIRFLGQHGVDCNIKIKDISGSGSDGPGVSIFSFANAGWSPLRIAIRELSRSVDRDLSALEALLQAGSNPHEIFDHESLSTPLHLAITLKDFDELLCELLAVHGAQISAVNGNGETPLRLWATDSYLLSEFRHASMSDRQAGEDWRRGRWLLRHGASLSELGNARCHLGMKARGVCPCRALTRVLACGWGEDDQAELQEASHEFERRREEWFNADPYPDLDSRSIASVRCGKVLLDWLVEPRLDESSQD
ncbi:hypothetical protein MMC18_005849 [Xylographa bjoerkii]|nr:hypothetical protein [Xylographa bjoerkii]